MDLDVLFIHAPAAVDGARHTLDADVAYTHQFVAIPIGVYSMADNLEKAGFRVRILNLGERAWHRPRQSLQRLVRDALADFQPRLVGLDIHWMIHSAGAVETARHIKALRPDIHTVVGGISASFFVRDILRHFACIDFVLRGECDDAMVSLAQFLLRQQGTAASVPNLAWRRGRLIRMNPVQLPRVEDTLELTRYDLLADRPKINPDRALISFLRGCFRNCCHCAGARDSFGHVMSRQVPCMIAPETLVTLMVRNHEKQRDKIYLYGDIRMGGPGYVKRFFQALNRSGLTGCHVVIEFFDLATADYVRQWQRWAQRTGNTLEATHSPESGNRKLRALFDKAYTNEALLDHCRLLAAHDIPQSVYFLLGLPNQTREEVEETLVLAGQIVDIFAEKFKKHHLRHDIVSYNFMQIPDAGSLMFRYPKRYGIQLAFHTFPELVRRLLYARHWSQAIGFKTRHMSPRDLVLTFYEIQKRILDIYRDHGVVPEHSRRQTLNYLRRDLQVYESLKKDNNSGNVLNS